MNRRFSGSSISFLGVSVLGLGLMAAAAVRAGQAEDVAKPEVVLTADQNGQFSGTVWINDIAMPFMIDTGATMTTVPMKLAARAKLAVGEQVETKTAGGKVFAKSTTINSLKFGAWELHHVAAHLNPNLEQGLIGMNVLKYFRMTQAEGRLTLILNEALLAKENYSIAGDARKFKDASTPDEPYHPISKSVVCDQEKHCITRYGN